LGRLSLKQRLVAAHRDVINSQPTWDHLGSASHRRRRVRRLWPRALMWWQEKSWSHRVTILVSSWRDFEAALSSHDDSRVFRVMRRLVSTLRDDLPTHGLETRSRRQKHNPVRLW